MTVGGGGKALAVSGWAAPRATDRFMEATLEAAQKKGVSPRNPAGTLDTPGGPELEERGDYSGPVLHSSLYTAASMHPLLTLSLAVGAGLAVAALVGAGSANGHRS